MYSMLRFALILTLFSACVGVSAGRSQASTGPDLGEPAPRIAASKWVRGTPVENFEPGQVYVIDFWSTWCKPCIDSMPTIHALESRYAEGLTVIAMNVWEMTPDRVPQFVESSKEMMPAHVAMDSVPAGKEANEGLTARGYLGTSDDATIPKTFLIDQEGRVVWIGVPAYLENPLSQVLAGTWDWKLENEKRVKLEMFARNYTAAWCSQNAHKVAEFFAEDGSLQINEGDPSVGRKAITAAAQSFMTAFPDLVVAMDGIGVQGDQTVYRWTLTGTSTDPDGTGHSVNISGYEEWTIGEDGLIAESRGHFDEADYNRQLSGETAKE